MKLIVDSKEPLDKQEADWEALYAKIKTLLALWGIENAFGKGDYLIVDDNYGWNHQQIEIHSLRMLKPLIIEQLHALLNNFPGWQIVIAVDVPGKEHWPPMGVTIRDHEIIDGLRRDVLPPEFKDFKIPGSRPGTGYD